MGSYVIYNVIIYLFCNIINKKRIKIEKNTSKRIYFDEKTLKMIEIMSPAYGIDPNTKENEK